MDRTHAKISWDNLSPAFFDETANVLFSQSAAGLSTYSVQNYQEVKKSETSNLLHKLEQIKIEPPLSSKKIVSSDDSSLELVLFDACANIKVLASRVSMHLDQEWKRKFFNRLDYIHDFEDWDEEDLPVSPNSFDNFIKWYIANKPTKSPGIGLTSNGNLIAGWISERDRLSIEFNQCEEGIWAITRYVDGQPERASGKSKIQRLGDVLSPYYFERFLY